MSTTYAELEDPGIQIIQKFESTSPTIAKPTLVACVVGPCYQVLEVYKTDATGNQVVDTDSQVSLPAILTAPTKGPYALSGKKLRISYKGGSPWEVTFVGTSLSALQVKDQINAATPKPSGWAPYVLTSGSDTYLQLRSTVSGDGEVVKLLDGDANAVFGWGKNYAAFGKSSYIQDRIEAAQASFPDPRSIVATGQADVDETSIRAFLNNGSTLAEIKRTESFLRRGSTATVAGTAALSFPLATLSGKKLELTLVKGGTASTMTFPATTAYQNISGNKLVSTGAVTPANLTTDVLKLLVGGVLKTVTFANPTTLQEVVDQVNAVYPCAFICTAAGVLDPATGTYVAFQPDFEDDTSLVAVYEVDPGSAFQEFFGAGTNHVAAGLVETINAGFNAVVAEEDSVTADVLRLKSGNGYLKLGLPTTDPVNTLLSLPAVATEYYGVVAVDDGDSDTLSPLLRFAYDNFAATEGSAVLTGSKILGVPDIHLKTLVVSQDGKYDQEIAFDCGPIVPPIKYTQPAITDTLGLIVNGTVRVITLAKAGVAYASIAEAVAQINLSAGMTVCYQSDVAGAAGTTPGTHDYIAFQVGGATNSGGSIVIDVSGCTAGGWIGIGFGPTVGEDIKQVLATPRVCTFAQPAAGETLGLLVNGVFKQVTFAGTENTTALYATKINTDAGKIVAFPCTVGGAYAAAGTHVAFQYGGACPTVGVVYPMEEMTHVNIWTALGLSMGVRYYPPLTALLTKISETMGAGFAIADSLVGSIYGGRLQLVSADVGEESKVECWAGTANAELGLTNNTSADGAPFAPQVGDLVFVEGTAIGEVLTVTPGGVGTDLRLGTEVTFSTFLKRYYHLVAQNIPSTLPSSRPKPNLVVNTAGDVEIKHDLVRDVKGAPLSSAKNLLMLTYKALRLDVTPMATSPGLLTYQSTTEVATYMKPVTSDNPLGLGLHFAALNATGATVSGLGVDAVSTSEPGGTQAAHARAQTFLESKEVWGLAPLSQTKEVIDSWVNHAKAMSMPDQKGERVVISCPALPVRKLHSLAGSGTDGDYVSAAVFDTKLTALTQALQALGLDPDNLDADDGVFLDISSDSNRYNLSSVTGTRVNVRTSFSPGENDDSFYATSSLPTTLISEDFTVYVRGAALVTADGLPDRLTQAQTYADLGKSYLTRRHAQLGGAQCAANINGTEQLLAGYYMAAAYVGLSAALPPQQGFTNYPISGFTRVLGSNDIFSDKQMRIGAAGGTWWVLQDENGTAIYARHQLTTDTTTVEKREFSITKVVDYVSKFLRIGLRTYIGRFNVTQDFLDTIGLVLQGMLSFLQEAGIIMGFSVNTLQQDASNPDSLLVDVTLKVPYPCNYMRITLVI